MNLSEQSLNLIDALILKRLDRVGDETVSKLINFTVSNKLTRLEDLAKVGEANLGLRKVPEALKRLLNANSFVEERKKSKNDIEEWQKLGISVIHLGTAAYPDQLLSLTKPPPFLFCKGKLDLLSQTKAIAVIGTRENSRKGQQITIKTVEAFAKQGFNIVSGLALGIDTIAHQAALNSGAPTISVLVDVLNIAPSTNRPLANEILSKGGLLIAENAPGTRVIPAFFAKRDRIQAGLSSAVFAIETSIDGGTMHAVNSALSMHRPVFVPNPKAAGYANLSAKEISGTQYLLREEKATSYTRESYESIVMQLSGAYTAPNNDDQIGLL